MTTGQMFGAVVLGFVFASGLAVAIKGWRSWRVKELIRSLTPSKVINLQPGLAALKGRIKPVLSKASGEQFLLKVRYSRKNCVYHSYILTSRSGILTRRSLLMDLMSYMNRQKGEERQPFLLEDGSGSVLILSRDADMRVDKNVTLDSLRLKEEDREPFRYFLEQSGFSLPRNILKSVWYCEKFLEPADEVYVLGTVAIRDAAETDWDLGNARKYAIVRNGGHPFLITDQKPGYAAKMIELKALVAMAGGGLLMLVGSLSFLKVFSPNVLGP